MAVPKEFVPTVELPQLQQAIELYKQQPKKFTPQDYELLKNHAEYYHIPFAEDEESNQGRISGLLSQLGSGFVSGFSTFHVGEAPRDEYESIARNLGHLAGFVGYIPAKPFQLLHMKRLAGAAKALKGRSVPMVVANYATEKAGKLTGSVLNKGIGARAGAANDAMSFLGKPVVKDLIEGSFHLGVASAASTWQEGVDGMMAGFVGGAQTGLIFRGIGNFLKTGDKTGDKVLRGLASSLFTGLPATMAGATTPEQIYEYLLGAYFGVKEMPYHRRAAGKHLQKMQKEGTTDPETVAGWEKLDSKTQKAVKDVTSKTEVGEIEQNAAMAYELLVQQGMSPEKAQKEAQKFIKEYKFPEISEEGEVLSIQELSKKEKAKVTDALEKTKQEETDLSNHRDDTDIGVEVQRFSVNTENFVRSHLKKAWEGTDNPRSNINIAASTIETKWKGMYEKARELKEKNPSDDMVNFIEDTYKTKLDTEAKNYWRQQGEVRLKARPVAMLSVNANPYKRVGEQNDVIELEYGIDTNLVGNRKRLLEPNKLLDFVYKNQYESLEGKSYDPTAEGRPYKVLDHVVMMTSNGLKEVPLSRIKQEYQRFIQHQINKGVAEYEGWKYEDKVEEASFLARKLRSDIDTVMNSKGYYYFGGKGDAARQYYVKYHPLVGTSKTEPSIGKIQMQRNNIDSIRSGAKTATSRSDSYHKKFYKGDGIYNLPNGEQVRLKRLKNGPFSIEELIKDLYNNGVGDTKVAIKDEFARMEGFKNWKDMELNSRPETKNWMKGTGKKHVYLIDSVKTRPRGKKEIENVWKDVINIQSKAFKKSKSKIEKELDADIKRWARSLGLDPKSPETIQRYKDSYLSNIFYELGMNGFENVGDRKTFREKFNTVLGDGFINDAKAFNKRSQIWFTTGFSSNPEYIAEKVKDLSKPTDKETGKYKTVFVEDSPWSELNSDGAILGRKDVIDAMNSDWGMPLEGGANKSFIVHRHPDKGAVLGKYMIHEPSGKIQKWMREKNVHFIIPRTAVKQWGTRDFGVEEYDPKNKIPYRIKNLNNATDFIAPESFKGIFSEKVDSHNADWQKLPKQMLTNLTPFNFNPKKEDAAIIEDMFNTLSRRNFVGEKEWNRKLDKLIESPELFKTMEAELEANFDKLGIENVIKGIQARGNEKFANLAYSKIQNAQKVELEKARAEGEISETEVTEAINELESTLQVHEKLRAYAPNSLLGMFHKWSFPYLETSLRNYVVQTLTKPKVANSFSSRLRPYDIVLRKDNNTKAIREGNEEVFYLDDGFKRMKIKSTFWEGTKSLGEVWKAYNDNPSKTLKKELDSILSAALVRVPMDSISGAHVLKFGGFTGIRGFGSVVHPKSMEALGGADLDGDKAFGFFGSNEYGFRDSWKDLYKRQKEEFKGQGPDDMKKKYRAELAEQDSEILDMVKSPTMQYSPFVREYISDKAATGRNELGPAVVTRATLNAAYSSLRQMEKDGKFIEVEVLPKEGNKPAIYARVVTRKNSKSMERFREKARAMIALTSDPMDEAGLKSGYEMKNSLFKEAFRFEPFTKDKNGKRSFSNKDITPFLKKSINNPENRLYSNVKKEADKAFFNTFNDVNSKLYGANLQEGKRWTFDEISESMVLADSILPENSRNNLLAKLPGEVSKVSWKDRLLRRIDYGKLLEVYNKHEDFRNSNEYQRLARAMGRNSSRVLMGRYIDIVKKFNLDSDKGINKALNSDIMNNYLNEKSLDKNGRPTKNFLISEMESGGYKRWVEGTEPQRKVILDKILNKSTDFIINDMSDMASWLISKRKFDKLSNREQAIEIINVVNQLKNESYLMGRNRRDMQKVTSSTLNSAQKKLLENMDKEFGDSTFSALADQHTIDLKIREYKKKLTPAEKEFFDSIMLGSINRGNHEIIQEYKLRAAKTKPTPEFWKRFNEIEKKAENTSISKLGFASQEVSPKVMQEHMKEFSNLFDNSSTKLSKKELETVKEEAELSDKPRPIVDENGNVVKGSMLEAKDYDEKTRKYLDEYAPFVGLKKGTLKGEYKELYYKLKNHLDYYHNGIGKNLNGLVRSVLNKDINSMNLGDFKALDRYLESIRTGTWWQQLVEKAGTKFPQLSQWDYLRFPEAVGRNMLRKEMDLVENVSLYKDLYGNKIMGKAFTPVPVINKLQNYIHGAHENSTKVYQEEKKQFREELRPYLESIENGQEFFELAVRKMEEGMMKTDKPNYDYIQLKRDANKKFNWNELKDKEYLVTTPDGKVQMKGSEVRQRIMNILEARNKKVHKWLVGEPEKIAEYENIVKTSLEKDPKKFHLETLALKRKFLKDIEDSFARNKPFDIGLGMDGLSRVSKLVLASQIPDYNRVNRQRAIMKMEIEKTGELPPEAYFPHLQFDRVKARDRMLESIERIAGDNTLSKEDKQSKMQGLLFHYKQLTGDWASLEQSRFGQHWDKVAEAASAITEKKKKRDEIVSWFSATKKVRSQHRRSNEPIPGWEVSPEAYEAYMKNIVDSYYRLTSEIASRSTILDWQQGFFNRTKDKQLTNSWSNYLNLYAQGAMGYNEKVPRRWMEKDSNMKINGTPYSWFADSTVLNRINRIADKLGVQKGKSLPSEFKELGKFSFEDLSRWTNMEAKYQLASLLAHPKSAVANLYGGTVHTVISTGWDNFQRARNFKYLQTNVNPKWKNMSSVEDWVIGHGINEEFLLYEADINPNMKGRKWKGFVEEAVSKIKKDPELSDSSLREIWRKHGITDAVFNKAAWFMRRPERTLRRDSFVAHYLQAREKFGNAIKDYDHPFLIEMAKKGVKSTQFLYSAPFRPMFARSALGKVMTRFQLWAWNSVRFRNEVIREAQLKGWKPGTQEFERFKRLATADLFTLGLANVFMYSLFENSLPAPWNWFQDTADFMFGEDKDRERAFFGAYPAPFQPLQVITPPAARILPPLFKGMVTDDYSKLSEYYVWTMFPFGRLGRDVIGPKGLLQNPAYGIEKLTGLPYTAFSKEVKGKSLEKEGMEVPRAKGLIR